MAIHLIKQFKNVLTGKKTTNKLATIDKVTKTALCKVVLAGTMISASALISATAFAFQEVNFGEAVVGYNNFSTGNSALFLSASDKAYWFSGTTLANPTPIEVAPECKSTSQDTSFAEEGLTLAYPFMVGLGRICMFENFDTKLSFVGTFDAPIDSFSAAFLAENNAEIFFAINSKPSSTAPEDNDGLLTVLRIEKNSRRFSLNSSVVGIPGYSGAMTFDKTNQTFLLTEATGEFSNNLYSLDSLAIINAAVENRTVEFASVATPLQENFEGLSFGLLSNTTTYLYLNSFGYDSYSVEKNTGSRTVFESEECVPVLGLNTSWVAICKGTTLTEIKLN